MARFSPDQLRDKALLALEEAVRQTGTAPLPPSDALRFALAYLANEAKEQWPFVSFWQAVTSQDDDPGATVRRRQNATASLNGIYVQLGLQRP